MISGLIGATAIFILVVPIFSSRETFELSAGDVTNIDIIAPRSITYVSQIQTDNARAVAANAVAEVYDPPDSRVTRQQVTRARRVLDFIDAVRADSFATTDQKYADLTSITDFNVTPDLARSLLSLDEAEWGAVQSETIAVIERVMSGQVREDRIEEARNRLPALVSVNLSEEQAGLVAALATPYIAPNSFYNDAATQAARGAAAEAVAPVSQSFVQGQIVISRGKVITEADLEALAALGLLRPEARWQNAVSNVIAVLVSMFLLALYMRRFNRAFFDSPRMMIYLGVLFLIFLLGAKLTVPGRTVLPFLFPSAAMSMLVAVVLGPNVAITMTVILAALVGYMADGRLDVTIYVAIGGIVSALTLGRAERLNAFFWAGLSAALANVGIILVFRLSDPSSDSIGIATLLGASLLNGAFSAAITLIGLFVFGSLFDITTPLQLVELARPNHPLLQFMLRQAPGTYQHSLQVANLAEQAGERIGADTVLIRVGALFHDVGKSLHPEYFVENQIEGENPHDRLPPELSAQYIIQHVPDGLRMAEKHRLPRVIRDCIAEHHGTNLTMFQYRRALQVTGGDESKVDKSHFRYPGPKPQTRETGLLMLADGCEAKARSDLPRTAEDIERIVRTIVDGRLAAGQLDECGLTLRDLGLARESFVETLKGFFHSRLKYPEEKAEPLTEEEELMRKT
jgi:hypothetical protein